MKQRKGATVPVIPLIIAVILLGILLVPFTHTVARFLRGGASV